MVVANVDGEVEFPESEEALLYLLTPSLYLVVAVVGTTFKEQHPKEGAENVDVRTGRSDDAASKIIDDFIVELEAWIESAETSA